MQRLPKRKAEKAILKWLNRYTLPPQRVIKKSHAFLVVIGDSIVAGLRRNPTLLWRVKRYSTTEVFHISRYTLQYE